MKDSAHPLSLRRGIFYVSANHMEFHPDEIAIALAGVTVLHCELQQSRLRFMYVGLCPEFDVVERHVQCPEYECIMEKQDSNDSPQVTIKRWERIHDPKDEAPKLRAALSDVRNVLQILQVHRLSLDEQDAIEGSIEKIKALTGGGK